jgi:hypothetical protein
MARKAVARRLGREPTLAELVANLEAVKGELKVRTIRVPPREELERRLKAQQRTSPEGMNPKPAPQTSPAPP